MLHSILFYAYYLIVLFTAIGVAVGFWQSKKLLAQLTAAIALLPLLLRVLLMK